MFNSKSILGMGLALALGGLAQAQMPDLASAIETARQEADRPGFSGAIIILQDGQTVLEEYRGLADQSSDRANNVDTRFNIASIGKFVTAITYRAAADEAGIIDFAGVHPGGFSTGICGALRSTAQCRRSHVSPHDNREFLHGSGRRDPKHSS